MLILLLHYITDWLDDKTFEHMAGVPSAEALPAVFSQARQLRYTP